MHTLMVGLIASPDLPAAMTGKIVDHLPNQFKKNIDSSVSWDVETIIDPLIGSAEYMNEKMDKAIHLKNENDWDYVICITDLPQFMENYVVTADLNSLSVLA